jgi:hypothetical protein
MPHGLPCHRGQAKSRAPREPAEAGTVVLDREQHPVVPPAHLGGNGASQSSGTGRVGEQVGSHPAEDNRIQLYEYGLRRPYQNQVTRPRHPLGGCCFVDNSDDVRMSMASTRLTGAGPVEPVIDHIRLPLSQSHDLFQVGARLV